MVAIPRSSQRPTSRRRKSYSHRSIGKFPFSHERKCPADVGHSVAIFKKTEEVKERGRTMHLFPPHPQRVRHAIDVVEPGSDQRDLQNSLIIKSRGSQPFDIIFPNLGRV